MKFTVSSSALLSLLATTGKVISNKNTLPILDYFLLELKDNELTVTTSDLETTLVGHLQVDSVEREGVIAAPAKLMLDSLKEFPEMPLEFDVNDTTWEIKIRWASGSLSIPGASAVSYPAMQTIGAEHKENRFAIIIDEAHFLPIETINVLKNLTDSNQCKVFCFGRLKQKLLKVADRIIEVANTKKRFDTNEMPI